MNSNRGPKISALVINAIRRLQDVQGSTTREINNYIAQEYDVPNKDIKKQVQIALRRGLSFGILQRTKGGYYVCNALSPTNALCDVQDDGFGCKVKRKKKMKMCRRGGSRRSRSRKSKCGCKKGMKRRSRRKSMKRKCGKGRSRSRSKRRSRKSKKSCKSGGSRRMRKSRMSRRSRSRNRRSCAPKRPKKCNDLEINKPENVKERDVNSNTSINSESDPVRQISPNRSQDEGSD